MYSIYARIREDNVVTHLFSDMFEKPKSSDILIKSGDGEEFIHIAEGGG